MTQTDDISMNSRQLQDILQKCSFEAVEQLLLDFAGQIPFLGLSLVEERLVEHSQQTHLFVKKSCEDASETELWQNGISDALGEDGRLIIQKKRASLHRKAVRESRMKVMERFL